MKSKLLCMLFCIGLFLQVQGQMEGAYKNLKEQAAIMGAAFTAGDYASFARFTYPKILTALGGQAKLAEILKKNETDMKSQGMTISKISFDEPTTIIKTKTELQSTIAQHTEIKYRGGRAVSTSTLIGISTNNGADWTFIDSSNKDLPTLRKIVPTLSPQITIPPVQPPVRYNN